MLVRMSFAILAASAAASLSSCHHENKSQIPAPVEQHLIKSVPIDGRIRSVLSGRIHISADTPVCETWKTASASEIDDRFGVDSSELFGALGQPSVSASGDRQISTGQAECTKAGSVIIHGVRKRLASSQGYRLDLAVWQRGSGSALAYWVGSVGRVYPHLHPSPRYPIPIDGGKVSQATLFEGSALSDERDLARRFVRDVSNKPD